VKPPRVVVIYRFLPHYRRDLYVTIHRLLARRGIGFAVWIGDQTGTSDAQRNDSITLPFSHVMPTLRIALRGRDFFLHRPPAAQPAPSLVICEQAIKVPLYFWYYALSGLRRNGFAWWGQGRHFQNDGLQLMELAKRLLTRWSALWISYNGLTDRVLRDQLGVRPKRIWSIDNAIDTQALAAAVDACRAIGRAAIEAGLNCPPSSLRVIFCGGLHPSKNIRLLLAAFTILQQRRPDAQLVVIGDGIDRPYVAEAAGSNPRIRMVGFAEGGLKARWLSIGDVFVCPGMTGLNILDAFSTRLPFVTVDIPTHSPEIFYLVPGANGLLVPPTPTALADGITRAVATDQSVMIAAAWETARFYTSQRMAARFTAAILLLVRHPRYGRTRRQPAPARR